jgi:hypothetical protein
MASVRGYGVSGFSQKRGLEDMGRMVVMQASAVEVTRRVVEAARQVETNTG